ncbi:MAG TPA: cation diffusion facilitator family transporter, partial [Paludibacter sp.]|nr:cation diffusion facilitator family transporter [Paludibacter sp.]
KAFFYKKLSPFCTFEAELYKFKLSLYKHLEVMAQEKKNAAFASVLASFFITGFKLIVGLLTGSLGIISEALHSALDMVAAVITYFSVRVSDKPADKEHNYGHGKVENLSAFIETILLLITCVWIIYEATHRLLIGKTEIEVTPWSYVVVITSILIDYSRSRKLSRVAKKHNSQALEADALHFSTDIWSSAVVLFGLFSYQFLNWKNADSVAALLVAAIVLVVAYRLGRKAIDVLLDKSPVNTAGIVDDVLKNYPEVLKCHSLKSRTAGADTFIKFDLHFDPELSLHKVHEVCDKIENELRNKIPRSEIYIHAEPEETGHVEKERNSEGQ